MVTGVAKVGLACCLLFVVVMVARRASLGARVSEAWAMHRCAGMLQDDLDVLLMEKSPKVRRCVGPAIRAVCEVETVEWRPPCGPDGKGQERIVRTAPLASWDCTRRHVPSGQAGLIMKVLLNSRTEGPKVPLDALVRAVNKVSPRDRAMIEGLDTVASRLGTRQALIDAQR